MMDPRYEPFVEDERAAGSLADLLDAVARFLRRFVVFQSRAQSDAVALWVAHTHVLDAVEQTPYLHVRSAQKRSGKSLLLEILGMLTCRAWSVIGPSEAVLFRRIERDHPTLILDEIDTVFRNGARKDDNTESLRGVLNAGCRKGATVSRCVPRGKEIDLVDFAVWCPKVLGGIGDIPDTIADRSIRIELRRKRPADQVERFRHRYVEPEAVPIREALEGWSVTAVKVLTGAEPDLPDELHDRAQDAWEPLLAIADLAGDPWPSRTRAAAVELTPSDIEDDSIGVQLLADIRTVFDDAGARLFTADLLERLVELDSRPWGDWSKGKPITARKVAGLLRPFDVHPVDIRIGNTVKKGYHAESFTDAWSRYLHTADENALQSNSPGQAPCSASSSGSDPLQSDSAGQTLFSAGNTETAQVPDQGRSAVADEPSPERGNGTSRAPIEPHPPSPCVRCGDTCQSARDGIPQHPMCTPRATRTEVAT